jgi:hypothetical protein
MSLRLNLKYTLKTPAMSGVLLVGFDALQQI